jgi:hypothetical protein
MFAYRHDIFKAMIDAGLRLVVVGVNESPDFIGVPQCKDQQTEETDGKPRRFLSCTPERLMVICAEENLLCYRDDPYAGESIVIREFARALHTITGHRPVGQEPDKKAQQQYELGETN